jgi:hypothetical protein
MTMANFFSDNIQFFQVLAVIVIIGSIIYFVSTYSTESMTQLQFAPLKKGDITPEYNTGVNQESDIEGNFVYPVTTDLHEAPFRAGNSTDISPIDLLPTSQIASEFSAVPGEMPDLNAKNFLVSGFAQGINTQSNVNRNANYQLRSDPVIPVNLNATPFSQSTWSGDLLRKQFEIGTEGC